MDLVAFTRAGTLSRRGPVLDIGCGEGSLATLLIENGFFDIYGVDWLPEERIPAARRHALKQYVQLDLNSSRLDSVFDDRFEIITCSDVLEHLENPAAILRSAARLLSPSGSLYVTLPNVANIFQRLSWLVTGNSYRYRTEKPGEFGHISLFPSQVLTSLLNRAGLECVRIGKGYAAARGYITLPSLRFGQCLSYVSYYEIRKSRSGQLDK